jgi:hypothetical protein
MSFAPRDSHEAQVQFALERGVPAVIGVLGTIKLPYPSRAFDMAHCSRCLIPWGANGKLSHAFSYTILHQSKCSKGLSLILRAFIYVWCKLFYNPK